MPRTVSNSPSPISGRRILIVEDEYLVAMDLAITLERLGAEVLGPAGSVREALDLLAADVTAESAVLDINLGGERVWPVAARLRERGVPFVFVSGYDNSLVPGDFADVPRCAKPVDKVLLARSLRDQFVAGDDRAG